MAMIIHSNSLRVDDPTMVPSTTSHCIVEQEPAVDKSSTAAGTAGETRPTNNGSAVVAEPEEHPGPLLMDPEWAPVSRYSDTHAISLFQEVTDDVSGALSDVSFGTSISSASGACSLPLESLANQQGRSATSVGASRPRRNGDDMSSPGLMRDNNDKCGEESSRRGVNFAGTRTSPSSSNNHHRRLKSARKRSGRLMLAKNLVTDAARFLEVGEDEKALHAYQQAIQIAGSEIARINVKIRTSASHSDAVQRSIKERLGQDLRKVGISVGKLRTKMAIVYERLGDYDNAILCCQEAATLYKNLPIGEGTRTNSKTGPASDLVQAIQLMIQQLHSTKEALRGRDGILQELGECRVDADRATSIARRVKCFIRMEKLASAAMAVEVKILGACHPQVADSLQLLSTISLELSNTARAIHFLDQAIAISQQCLGDKHPRIGQYCLRLARIQQTTGAEADALANFEKANQVLSHSKKYSRILGSTMNDLAVLHMRRGETSLALEKLHLSLKHYTVKYDRCKKSPVDAVTDDIIQVHQNMAACYMAEGSFGRASETYAEILALQRRSREMYGAVGGEDISSPCVDDASIAQTLVNLGRASAGEGAHDKAIKSLKKALGMLNTLAAEEVATGEPDTSSYVEYKRRITKVMYCIAEESVITGDLEEAMAFYADSIGIFNLLGQKQQGPHSGHIAHCHIGISKVLVLRNNPIGARALLKKTLRNCVSGKIQATAGTMNAVKGRLAEIDAQLSRPDEGLPILEENARDQINENALDVAMMNLRAALSIRKKNLRRLKAIKADVSAEVQGVANLLDMFALVYIKQGDMESSSRAYAEAYRLRSKRSE